MNELDWELEYAYAEKRRKKRFREWQIAVKRVPPITQHNRVIRLASPFELRLFTQADGSIIGLIYYAVWAGKRRPERHSLWAIARVTMRKG